MRFATLFITLLFSLSLTTGCTQATGTITTARRVEIERQIVDLDKQLAGVMPADKRVDALVTEGVLYRELGKLSTAEKKYLAALEAAPKYYLARHNLAVVYEEMGKKEAAIRQYRAMNNRSASVEERAEAVDKMVVLYLQLNRPDDAEQVLNVFAKDFAKDTKAQNLVTQLRTDIANARADHVRN